MLVRSTHASVTLKITVHGGRTLFREEMAVSTSSEMIKRATDLWHPRDESRRTQAWDWHVKAHSWVKAGLIGNAAQQSG